MKRRDALQIGMGIALGYLVGSRGCSTGCSTKRTVNPPTSPVPGAHEDFNRLFRQGNLDQLLQHEKTHTYEFSPGIITAPPSGNREEHEDWAEENNCKAYRSAGFDLDKLQKILLVDFRDARRNIDYTVSERDPANFERGKSYLNHALMPSAAVALRMFSDHIGTLDHLDSSLPGKTLIELMEENITSGHPYNFYRSWDMQGKVTGMTASQGRSPHGTGIAIDFPEILVADDRINNIFRYAAKKFGFAQGLIHNPGELDFRHFEYVGNVAKNFPTFNSHMPDHPNKYPQKYRNWAGGVMNNLPTPRNFPRPQDLAEYAMQDPRILEASLRR